MKKIIIFGLAGCLMLLASTHPAEAAVSESAVLFLKISPGGRYGGMGEAGVALTDDASATWWNPAGLGFQNQRQITMMHANWLPQFHLPDLYYDFISYVHTVPELGTFGANVIFLNLGTSTRTDEQGNEQGTFSTYEGALSGSYGTQINKNTALGISARFIYSHLSDRGAGAEKGSGVATGVGVDIGVLHKMTMIKGLQLGANISNLGPKISYIDAAQADPIPTNLKMGFAYHVLDSEFNKLTVLGDIDKELVRKKPDGTSDPFYVALVSSWFDEPLLQEMIYHVGTEYWYTNLVGLRMGYWNDQQGKVKPLTFGASLQYSVYRFDFSYVSAGEGHPLTDTMRFSLSIGL
ncbi:MAG: PorV/PorQ family protein [bacterium]|nr:PorV/PorQ family protein [bacterium]